MEAIVTWGFIKKTGQGIELPVSEELVCSSEQAAAQFAVSMMVTLTKGEERLSALDFYVSAFSPKTTKMSTDNCAFVQVRLNDGITAADMMGMTCSPEAEALGFQTDHQMHEHAIWLADHKKPGYSAWLQLTKAFETVATQSTTTYVRRLNAIGETLGRKSMLHVLPEVLYGAFPEEVVVEVTNQLRAEDMRLTLAEQLVAI